MKSIAAALRFRRRLLCSRRFRGKQCTRTYIVGQRGPDTEPMDIEDEPLSPEAAEDLTTPWRPKACR